MIGYVALLPQDSEKQNAKQGNNAKAHFDCYHGVNDMTLLAACLDALYEGNTSATNTVNDVDRALEVLHSSIFSTKQKPDIDAKSGLTRRAFVKRSTSKQRQRQKHLCIAVVAATNPSPETSGGGQEELPASGILDTLYREILDCFDSEKSDTKSIVQWGDLPEWVVETTKCVFTEVFKAHAANNNENKNNNLSKDEQLQLKNDTDDENHAVLNTSACDNNNNNNNNNNKNIISSANNDDDEVAAAAATDITYSYIFNVIATLICLDTMGVRNVSCSPLPMMVDISSTTMSESLPSLCTTNYVGALVDLQKGMTVDPSVTKRFDFDDKVTTTPQQADSMLFLSTAIGISMLRVLTGAASNKSSQRSRIITPMVLQKRGCGVDENDATLKVSIVVGGPTIEDTECGSSSSESGITNPGVNNNNDSSSMRMMIREQHSLFRSDHVAHLETNLDDISGENLAFAIELLLTHGAIDAWATPIVMKKGRPAHTLHCLCKDDVNNHNNGNDNGNDNDNMALNVLLELIFVHTSTLGVRIYRRIPRAKLDRSMVTVTTPFTNTSRKGKVDVKISRFKNGLVVRKKAEFDHCKEIAIENSVGIKVVADEAIKAYDNMSNCSGNST